MINTLFHLCVDTRLDLGLKEISKLLVDLIANINFELQLLSEQHIFPVFIKRSLRLCKLLCQSWVDHQRRVVLIFIPFLAIVKLSG